MKDLVYANFEHVLCLLILFGRVGDILSTYLVTPTLALEGNLIAKSLGWRFAPLTLLVCLVPYYSTSLGVMVLVPSLLVAASNAGMIWLVRGIGEKRFAEMVLSIARNQGLLPALLCVAASAAFVLLAGLVLLALCPRPGADWGYWYAMGILTYGLVILVHGSVYYWRLVRKAKEPDDRFPASDLHLEDR